MSDPIFAAQSTWFIDGQNVTSAASDDGDGKTPGTPILTWREYRRRVGSLPVASSTITILSSLAAGDVLRPPRVPPRTLVTIKGTPGASAFASSTLSAATPKSTTTNAAWSVSGLLPGGWGALVNHRLRITTGANAGAVAWVAKDLGGGRVRVSSPQMIDPPAPFPYGAYSEALLAAGDSFVVEQLPYVGDLIFDEPVASDYDESVGASLVFEGLSWVDPAGVNFSATVVPAAPGQAAIRFIGCQMAAIQGSAYYHACAWSQYTDWTDGYPNLFACFLPGDVIVEQGCAMNLSADTLIQANGGVGLVMHSSTIQDGEFAVFDSAAEGVNMEPGSVLTTDSTIWGAGNARHGICVQGPGSTLSWMASTAVPAIAGALGDALVGGDPRTWAVLAASGGHTAPNGASAWLVG